MDQRYTPNMINLKRIWSSIGYLQKRLDSTSPGSEGAVSAIGSPNAVSNIWSGSQAQYDAIVTKDAATLYFIV